MRKTQQPRVHVIEGIGVQGDAHAGATVKHRSRVAKDPTQPNLRQVHLIHAELHDALREAGYCVTPGEMGENITTRGVDLLRLPTGTRLRIGTAELELTGLRNPCGQLNGIAPGLQSAVLTRDANGNLVRLAGVMAIVVGTGDITVDDAIAIRLPAEPHVPLAPV